MADKNNDREEKKNQRGENWTQEEKDIFLKIMRHSAPIIENKQTDTDSNKRRYLEWLKVQSKLLQITNKRRDVVQLKGFWRRCKLLAKKKLYTHTTGKEPQPASSSQEDHKIISLWPTGSVVEPNTFVSDGVHENMGINENAKSGDQDKNNSTMLNIELKKQTREMLAEEHEIKMQYHKRELDYQELRQKLNADILLLQKEKKELEIKIMEDEYKMKLQYQKQELDHQEIRHKLDVDVLLLEKEKKELELKKIKMSFE